MSAIIGKEQANIDVRIHESFYFDSIVNLPTIIKEYENIENIFVKLEYMACITIQVEALSTVEYRYGSNSYNHLRSQLAETIKSIKDKNFREKDILVMDLYDTDTFIIFLSAPREDKSKLIYHLEDISERIRIILEQRVFRILYPYLKNNVRPNIGYALEIKNPMVNNMRLIRQLVRNSKQMGVFMTSRRKYISRYRLQKLIIEKDLQIVFQPIVNLETFEIIGYEALSRGPSETEFTNPKMLFFVATECGLSFELDRVCRKKAFEKAGTLNSGKKIFVNSLSMTIHDPEFRGIYLKELLEDMRIKPENVVFEISEKLAIDNYDLFRSAMKNYTDIGIVHAGDDIGTGYSDLERIMELDPGYLKVDISFVKDIDKSFIKQEIVRALVDLSNRISTEVIVEGIETKDEYETLKKLNVLYGQGFLFAEPSNNPDNININF